jgi:hypothetical protein
VKTLFNSFLLGNNPINAANNQFDDAGAIGLIESLPNSKNSLKLIDLSISLTYLGNNEKISDQTNVQEKLQEYFINVNITFA